MSPRIKIALIQLYPEPLSPTANFEKAKRYIHSAAAEGAELAVLPEYHLTSWRPKDPSFVDACKLAVAFLGSYQTLAKELHISIVPGTLVEVDTDEEGGDNSITLSNAAYFISHRGEIVSRYGKKNLWHDERPHLQADPSTHAAFDTELGRQREREGEAEERNGGLRAGMLVCWDLAFPEAMRELVRDGARLVIVPAFWLADEYANENGELANRDSEKVFLDSVVVARAFESCAAVVFVNAGGPPGNDEQGVGGVRYCGVSQVGMPLLGSMGKMGSGEGMSVVDIDVGTLDVADEAYKVREDLAREGWHYGYSLVKEGEGR